MRDDSELGIIRRESAIGEDGGGGMERTIAREDRTKQRYRPSTAGKKGLLLFLTPEQDAALQELARTQGQSKARIGLEALEEWMQARGGAVVVEQQEATRA